MKSFHCEQCNASSSRFAWGFALLARDPWQNSPVHQLLDSGSDEWLCPTCRARCEAVLDGEVQTEVLVPTQPLPKRSAGKLRVLLVDDEEIVRRCTLRMLSEFDVVSTSSALEAIHVLDVDRDFDVVLSDVMMPGMSGPELYALCYRNFPSLARRFVFASGNADVAQKQLQRAVESVHAPRCPALLPKPSSRELLIFALRAAAAHEEPLSGMFKTREPQPSRVAKYRG